MRHASTGKKKTPRNGWLLAILILGVALYLLYRIGPLFGFDPVGEFLDRHPVFTGFLIVLSITITLMFTWQDHVETGSREFYFRLGGYWLVVWLGVMALAAYHVVRFFS